MALERVTIDVTRGGRLVLQRDGSDLMRSRVREDHQLAKFLYVKEQGKEAEAFLPPANDDPSTPEAASDSEFIPGVVGIPGVCIAFGCDDYEACFRSCT